MTAAIVTFVEVLVLAYLCLVGYMAIRVFWDWWRG